MTRLKEFGYRGEETEGIARIVSHHGDYFHLVCNETTGEILARKKKSAFTRMKTKAPDNMKGKKISEKAEEAPLQPITGDFVRFRYNQQGDSMITEVLPRFSHFERKDPTARRTSQTLAVNFDTLFIMMSLNEDFSTARIDRYLTLAEDIGEAEAVVVITKMDLKEDGDEEFIEALEETVDGRAKILYISSLTGEGMDEVEKYAAPGKTLAFIGSSGVGKSTLVNTLAGEEWSGKGRHTTTSRELVLLPSGALILDTPGIREIGILGEVDNQLQKGFSNHRFRK